MKKQIIMALCLLNTSFVFAAQYGNANNLGSKSAITVGNRNTAVIKQNTVGIKQVSRDKSPKISMNNAVKESLRGQALKAGQDRGGGDMCESRIQVIANDIRNWIFDGGHEALDLKGLSPRTYSDLMLREISTTSIRCVSPGDEGHPVQIDDVPKVCVWAKSGGEGIITCDTAKFYSLSESDQYVLIHHEYASIAGLETPNGSVSDYEISNQITKSLTYQTVLRLAVKGGGSTLNGTYKCQSEPRYSNVTRELILSQLSRSTVRVVIHKYLPSLLYWDDWMTFVADWEFSADTQSASGSLRWRKKNGTEIPLDGLASFKIVEDGIVQLTIARRAGYHRPDNLITVTCKRRAP